MMRKIISVAALCLVLAACATYKPIDAVMPVDVGDNISVEPQVQWAHAVNQGLSGTVWTIDGFGLNELRFYTGIGEGAPLMSIPGVQRKDMGLYSSTMLPDDVMDLVATTLGKAGHQQIRSESLRPVPFGTTTGFRFDLAFTTADGLEMKGTTLFAQRRKKLDVILYIAPAEYYYDRYAGTVEMVLASVRIPDPPAQMGAMN